MYAVIETGGKQYRVSEGQAIKFEKLDVEPGAKVQFDKILMVADGDSIQVGSPYISGGKVTAEVLSQGRGKKVKIIKFRRRKHYRRQMGHRQYYTEVKITGITAEQSGKHK
jgi:large subunit ribosomal protein L21